MRADEFAGRVDAVTPDPRDRRPGASDRAAGSGPDADQRMLAVVSALRALEIDAAPDAETRLSQRRRLVAMAAVRADADTEDAGDRAAATRARSNRWAWAQRGTRALGRIAGRRAIAVVATLSVLVAATGVLVLLAQSALPGDALYAFKRGTEEAQLVFTRDGEDTGTRLLTYATNRLTELDGLIAEDDTSLRAAGSGILAAGGDDQASQLLIETMETMDAQTIEGTRSLTGVAVDRADPRLLTFVLDWGFGQGNQLIDLSDRMPAAAQDRAEESVELLAEVVNRLQLLGDEIDAECLDSPTEFDHLGPVPCSALTPDDPSESADPTEDPRANQTTQSEPTQPAPQTTVPGDPGGPVDPGDPGDPGAPQTGQPAPPAPPAPNVPAPPPPPADGTPCLSLGVPGVISAGICVPIPVPPAPQPPAPPQPPPDGTSCSLGVVLGIPILGIYLGGICVRLGG